MIDRYLSMGMSPDEVMATVQNMFPLVVNRFVDASAEATAQWYGELAPSEPYIPDVPVDPVKVSRLIGSARWAANQIADGVFDEARRQKLLDSLSGPAQRAVFDASRATVSSNAIAEGYGTGKPRVKLRRVAQPGACLFCATLATRGAVYYSAEAATKGHDHCHCVAVPERPGTKFDEPEYYQMWDKRYQEAKKAAGPASRYKDDQDPNAYFKAILSKMREQEAALGKEIGGIPTGGVEFTPAWDRKAWTKQRTRQRKALNDASTPGELQEAAQKLLGGETKVFITQNSWVDYNTQINGAWPGPRDARPAVDLTPATFENVRGAIRAVDDFKHRYPGVRIERITFHPDVDNTYAATWRWGIDDYSSGSMKINVNSKWINASSDNIPALVGGRTFDTSFRYSVDTGFHYRRDGGSGVEKGPSSYAVMTHELGHALVNHHGAALKFDPNAASGPPKISRMDSASIHVEQALADYYGRVHVSADKQANWRQSSSEYAKFSKWRRQNLSGYSFDEASYGGAIKGSEAIAEAFADVEINGAYAHESSKVLHRLAVDFYNGSSPYAGDTRMPHRGGDPDFMEWPDYQPKSDTADINYWDNKSRSKRPKGMDTAVPGAVPIKSDSGVESTAVEIRYVRNNNGMRQVVGFGQDSEPWGRYAAPAGDGDISLQPGWEVGTAKLSRPLYVDHNDGNWKAKLSARYGGATGKELSAKLIADGYDGVVTTDSKGIVEFVDVRSRATRKFTVESSTSTWQQSGLPPLVNTSWTDEQYVANDNPKMSKRRRAAARRAVDKRYEEISKVEPEISDAVVNILAESGFAVPHGLAYRMKEPPSLYRKVQEDMLKTGRTAEESLDHMRDIVRFTAIVPTENYWQNGTKIRKQLEALGAEVTKDPLGISYTGYRGRNMAFKLNGVEFELQVHTEKSMSVKDVCHKLYEVERRPGTSEAERQRLQAKQQRLWDTIPIEKGTPVVENPKAEEVWFRSSSTRNIGPTVPIIHEKGGTVRLPYGAKAAGWKHPPIDFMVDNVVSGDMAAWERLTPEEKEWGILWYKRLRWFLAEDSQGTVYEGDVRRAAAIYAALSPRTDFDINYAAVRKVLKMDLKDVARLVPKPADGDPLPADEFGPRPFLNGVIPANLERVKRILAVDDAGKWVVSDPVWALRGQGADDMFYPHPAKNRVRMYHRTSLESADSIRLDRRFISREKGDVFLSDQLDGSALGYGQGVVVVDVPRARWQPKKGEWTPGIDDDGVFHGVTGRIDDEFPGGEKHYAIQTGDIDPAWIVKPRVIPDARAANARIKAQREAYDRRVYEAVKRNGGITISLEGDTPVEGYAYAPSKGTETRIPLATFKPEDVDHYIDAHFDQLQRPGAHLGLWVQGDDVFLDVSKVGKPTAATIKGAQDVEQLGVYDLGSDDTIDIGIEDADGHFTAAGKASDLHNQHRREVEQRDKGGSPAGAGEVPGDEGGDQQGSSPEEPLEELYLMLQRGPRDQAALEAGKIYNHALNVLDEEEEWAVTVDTWDARVKLAVRDDKSWVMNAKGKPMNEARRVLDGVMPAGMPNANQDEKNEIYQEFAEATRRAVVIIREQDEWARELARANGYPDLMPKHVQAGVWGAARRSLF